MPNGNQGQVFALDIFRKLQQVALVSLAAQRTQPLLHAQIGQVLAQQLRIAFGAHISIIGHSQLAQSGANPWGIWLISLLSSARDAIPRFIVQNGFCRQAVGCGFRHSQKSQKSDMWGLMNEVGNFPDGQKLLTGSPLQSGYFLSMSMLGLAALLWDVYLICQYWHSLNMYFIWALIGFIGIQLIYLWLRVVRYFAKLRSLYIPGFYEETKGGSSLDIALRIATGALNEILFYSYGLILCTLILVGVLLGHLYGAK